MEATPKTTSTTSEDMVGRKSIRNLGYGPSPACFRTRRTYFKGTAATMLWLERTENRRKEDGVVLRFSLRCAIIFGTMDP